MPDWLKVRKEYESTDITLKGLADKYKVSPGTVRSRKAREGWKKKGEAGEKQTATQRMQRNTKSTKKNVATQKKSKGEHSKPHEPNICGAKTRQGTMCKNPAGFRTPHFGTGRCYLHGGLSTGGPGPPKGNKNALKTGVREAIWVDVLPEDEQALYHEIITDKIAQLDQEIRLLDIRERRMLQRIENLKQADFTVVEKSTEKGLEKGEATNLMSEKQRATLGQIQDIEAALTQVQARKARLIDLKHKIEQSQGPQVPNIDAYIEALKQTAAEVWPDEKST